MRNQLVIMLIAFIGLIVPTIVQAVPTPHVSAHNAVLIEQSTGRVLFSKQAHEKQSVASITKMMTAIIALEHGDLDQMVTVSKDAVWAEGSSIYLVEGEKISLQDLIYGLMLRSGNDAAVAISEHIAGSVEGFAYLMNEKARWIGMTNTHFENPHGLESDNHYSTAYDMALLLRHAMENKLFKKVSGTSSYLSDNRAYHWHNKNKLLTTYYEHCTGGKTGFTKKAGRTLATTAHKDNMDLIAVTLNAPDDWQDHTRMFNWGYEHYDLKQIQPKGIDDFFVTESNEHINGFIVEDVYFPLRMDEQKALKDSTIILDNASHQGDKIGRKSFFVYSDQIIDIPIYSPQSEPNHTRWSTTIFNHVKQIMGLEGQ